MTGRHRLAPAVLVALLAGGGCAGQRLPATPASFPGSPAAAAAAHLRHLQDDLRAVTARAGVRQAAWGVLVHSLDRDEPLFELNPDTLLVPASLVKLAAVASAADAVGWDHRFETTLRATGPVADGVLRGDLLVVGSGDPTIGGRAGSDLTAWIDRLRSLGLRRINGRLVGDDDAVEDPRPALAWTWDDLGYATGALFGALNLRENRMTVTIRPGGDIGAPASVEAAAFARARPLDGRVVTGPPGSPQILWPEQRPGEPALTLAGSIPLDAGPASLAVSAGNPTAWFASVLKYELQQAGIDVGGPAVDIDDLDQKPDSSAAAVLHTHRSPPLAEIARPLLKDSINLYGEAVMRLNAPPGIVATSDLALDGLRARWIAWGLQPESLQVVDGSGLSRRNAMTARAVVSLLRRMDDPSGRSPFVSALPVAGVDGSLAGRMRGTPAEGVVRAKTGTMSNIRSLAGYTTTRDGERLAFAVLVNNFEGPATAATEAVDAIAVRLTEFSRKGAGR